MIDNFAPQPYPLEACTQPGTWALVIGWQRSGDGRLDPVLAPADGPLTTVSYPAELRYRVARTGPGYRITSTPAAAPTAQPARREPRGS